MSSEAQNFALEKQRERSLSLEVLNRRQIGGCKSGMSAHKRTLIFSKKIRLHALQWLTQVESEVALHHPFEEVQISL